MNQQDTRNQTRAAGADMRQGGMPNGQAPARQEQRQQMTAMQRAAADRQRVKTELVTAAMHNRENIERSLKIYNISFDAFMVALEVGLNQTMKNNEAFFEKVSVQSFLEAVVKAAHIGLLPDGKQGAIVNYGPEAAFMPMVEGYVEIIWKTGLVADMNHNVVCDGDDFEFEEGDSGYVRHKRSLTRPADASVIGAWCVINLLTRQDARLIEVVDQVDLQKIAKVSRATKGPRVDWDREMHRKAPFRRVVKRMPKHERLAALIAIDDRNVDLERLSAPEAEPAKPKPAVFGNRAVTRRAPREARPAETLTDQREDTAAAADDAPEAQDEAIPVSLTPELEAAMRAVAEADTLGKIGLIEEDTVGADWWPELNDEQREAFSKVVEHSRSELRGASAQFILRAVLSSRNGLQEFEEIGFWVGDIKDAVRRMDDQQRHRFWEVNKPYIDEAEPFYPEDVAKIRAFALQHPGAA